MSLCRFFVVVVVVVSHRCFYRGYRVVVFMCDINVLFKKKTLKRKKNRIRSPFLSFQKKSLHPMYRNFFRSLFVPPHPRMGQQCCGGYFLRRVPTPSEERFQSDQGATNMLADFENTSNMMMMEANKYGALAEKNKKEALQYHARGDKNLARTATVNYTVNVEKARHFLNRAKTHNVGSKAIMKEREIRDKTKIVAQIAALPKIHDTGRAVEELERATEHMEDCSAVSSELDRKLTDVNSVMYAAEQADVSIDNELEKLVAEAEVAGMTNASTMRVPLSGVGQSDAVHQPIADNLIDTVEKIRKQVLQNVMASNEQPVGLQARVQPPKARNRNLYAISDGGMEMA
jgi:hypothetical protein